MHLAITLIVLAALIIGIVAVVRRSRRRHNEAIAQRAADITAERQTTTANHS